MTEEMIIDRLIILARSIAITDEPPLQNLAEIGFIRGSWQHLNYLKLFQLTLLLHYVKQNPRTYFESAYSTLQCF